MQVQNTLIALGLTAIAGSSVALGAPQYSLQYVETQLTVTDARLTDTGLALQLYGQHFCVVERKASFRKMTLSEPVECSVRQPASQLQRDLRYSGTTDFRVSPDKASRPYTVPDTATVLTSAPDGRPMLLTTKARRDQQPQEIPLLPSTPAGWVEASPAGLDTLKTALLDSRLFGPEETAPLEFEIKHLDLFSDSNPSELQPKLSLGVASRGFSLSPKSEVGIHWMCAGADATIRGEVEIEFDAMQLSTERAANLDLARSTCDATIEQFEDFLCEQSKKQVQTRLVESRDDALDDTLRYCASRIEGTWLQDSLVNAAPLHQESSPMDALAAHQDYWEWVKQLQISGLNRWIPSAQNQAVEQLKKQLVTTTTIDPDAEPVSTLTMLQKQWDAIGQHKAILGEGWFQDQHAKSLRVLQQLIVARAPVLEENGPVPTTIEAHGIYWPRFQDSANFLGNSWLAKAEATALSALHTKLEEQSRQQVSTGEDSNQLSIAIQQHVDFWALIEPHANIIGREWLDRSKAKAVPELQRQVKDFSPARYEENLVAALGEHQSYWINLYDYASLLSEDWIAEEQDHARTVLKSRVTKLLKKLFKQQTQVSDADILSWGNFSSFMASAAATPLHQAEILINTKQISDPVSGCEESLFESDWCYSKVSELESKTEAMHKRYDRVHEKERQRIEAERQRKLRAEAAKFKHCERKYGTETGGLAVIYICQTNRYIKRSAKLYFETAEQRNAHGSGAQLVQKMNEVNGLCGTKDGCLLCPMTGTPLSPGSPSGCPSRNSMPVQRGLWKIQVR